MREALQVIGLCRFDILAGNDLKRAARNRIGTKLCGNGNSAAQCRADSPGRRVVRIGTRRPPVEPSQEIQDLKQGIP